MHKSIFLGFILFALVVPRGGWAADATPRETGFRIGLAGGVLLVDPDEHIRTGGTGVFRIGYQFSRVFAIEGDLGYSQGVTKDVGRLYHVLDPRLNVLLHIPTPGVVDPFFALGGGAIWKKVNRDASVGEDTTNTKGYGNFQNPDTDFIVNAGPGVLIWFGKDFPLGARIDARYLLNLGSEPHGGRALDVFHNAEFTAGLQGRFGPREKDSDGDGYRDSEDGCPQDPEDFDYFEDGDGCPDPDNDEDGILDVDDECPDEPEDEDGYQDLDGCPDPDNDRDGIVDTRDRCPGEPGPEETGGCPDSDGDGIADVDDGCPDEPGPANAEGCPDRDGDRVPDYRDDCPDEPADPRIDPKRSDGCPSEVVVTEEAVVILDKVYFEVDKDIIRSVSYPILNNVADVLNKYTDIALVEVAGHTDSDASEEHNLDLSQRRSEAVVDYLVDKGVERGRLQAKGYGEGSPIDTNETRDGKANNRRVEFNILED